MTRALLATMVSFAVALMAPRSARATACSSAADCATGFCVNAVCCDTRCDGPCEACSALAKWRGEDGTCGPAKRRCREPTCEGGAETAAVDCDATGACPAASPATSCGNYACEGSACRTTCRSGFDCAAGNLCDEVTRQCVPKDRCDGDHTVVGLGGARRDCTPYTCVGSSCLDICLTTAQCVAGYVCTGVACVAVASSGSGEDDGGCAVSGRARHAGFGAALGVIAFGRLARRRNARGRLARRRQARVRQSPT